MKEEIYQVLKKYFGYDQFRPMQEEIIQSVLEKKDCLVLMPTGGGKSICYQIPAIILPGVCVVVSPLISLMKDQVEGLKANGVEAVFLNSSISPEEQVKVKNLVLQGKIKLLYVSPEKLVTPTFLNFLEEIKVNLFAIDEAHCISSWGHDFRPEYTKLKILKEKFAEIPIIALTATADKITRRDISKQLLLDKPGVFVASFDRPNLSLNVLPGRDRFRIIHEFIKKRPKQSGIIYCLSRKSTEEISSKLKNVGIKATYYHAGMNSDKRSRVQERFANDDFEIICATIAFGMGIDKSNVRWIIHYNLPKNLESFYQEIGRAGRDGLASDTLLFYSFADVMTLRYFIETSGQKELQLAKLERIQQYADAQICRRKILLNYFSENLEKNCGNCDVCKNPPKQFDGTILALKALSAIYRLNQKVGLGMLIDVLRGSNREDILQKGYFKIKTYGAGKDISYQDWQQYLLQMLNLGLFEIAYDQKNVLRLTDFGKRVLFDNEKINLVHSDIIQKKVQEKIENSRPQSKQKVLEENLFEILRQVRKEIAGKENIAPYRVFHDTTLREMVRVKPLNHLMMKEITGVGDQKLSSYGETFINEIKKFVRQKDHEGQKIKGGTCNISYDYFKDGFSVEEIAQKRNLKIDTVYSHLICLYEQGFSDIELDKFLSKDEFSKIKKVLEKLKRTEKLKPIFDMLDGSVSYGKIKIGIAIWRNSFKK